jgi:glycosyltransferase involved in cell wall biosynthesis
VLDGTNVLTEDMVKDAHLARIVDHAVYATQVFHYDHVVQAMSEVAESVTLLRRFEITPKMVDRLRDLSLPSSLTETLARRARTESPAVGRVRGIGPGQFVPVIYGRLGRKPDPTVHRGGLTAQARRVARSSRGAGLLQFVDGMGFEALRRGSAKLTIAERRGFHYSTFEEIPEPIAGFPNRPRITPLTPDFFDEELEHSSLILVYSEAAKASYIQRGFAPERLTVCPLPLSGQLPLDPQARSPRKFLFAGRGDVLKGLDVAVAAVQRLPWAAELIVAGPMQADVLDWLSKQARVRYVGVLDKSELRQHYSTAAALVLPSKESFALVAVEAAYYGLHVVCKDDTGAAEFLPSAGVTIVPGRDPADWAEALEETAERCAQGEVCEGGAERLSGLDVLGVAARLETIYRELRERS